MNNINLDLLEEFKRLEKLCNDIYSTKNGVTSYIDDMKNTSEYESINIYNWDNDLKRLIELRHIRNKLAHDTDTFNIEMCTDSDIRWIADFHNRILNQTDPLSMLQKEREQKTSKPKSLSQYEDNNCDSNYNTARRTPEPHENNVAAFFIFAAAIIIILIFAFIRG